MSGSTADGGADLARLAAERDRLDVGVAGLEAALAGIDAARDALGATDDEHDPEGATIAVERAQVAGLLVAAIDARHAVEQAVLRVEAGTYRWCRSCGEAIGDERLAARPMTDRCIACARRAETGPGLDAEPARRSP